MLEAVGDEARKRDALHDLVVEHMNALNRCQAFDLREKDVRVQVIV